jgi:hypothetical protein
MNAWEKGPGGCYGKVDSYATSSGATDRTAGEGFRDRVGVTVGVTSADAGNWGTSRPCHVNFLDDDLDDDTPLPRRVLSFLDTVCVPLEPYISVMDDDDDDEEDNDDDDDDDDDDDGGGKSGTLSTGTSSSNSSG